MCVSLILYIISVFFITFVFQLKHMQENKSQLFNYAMIAGVFLGGFWVAKYLFVIGGAYIPVLNVVNSILAIGTPLLLYYYLVQYKKNIVGDEMGYWHGVQFSIMLFFFASAFEAIIVFIHVKWIDPTFIGSLYANMVETAQAMKFSEEWIAAISNQPQPSPFSYIFNNIIMGDVFIGLLLSLFIVPLALLHKPKTDVQ